ncbi:MAG: CBS domain-containing protein [Acidimicrobiales bacterium]|nr:CBS domain-containing protein [Acidimicrobiales bacterium]
MRVREMMQRRLVRCLPTTSVGDAAREMEQHHVDTTAITDWRLAAIGILTAGDVLRYVGAGGDENAPVETAMTKGVAAIDVDADVEDAIAAMDLRHVPYLLVVDFGGYPIGMLYRDDLVDLMNGRTLTLDDALGASAASPAG